jgi:hypothetical protein
MKKFNRFLFLLVTISSLILSACQPETSDAASREFSVVYKSGVNRPAFSVFIPCTPSAGSTIAIGNMTSSTERSIKVNLDCPQGKVQADLTAKLPPYNNPQAALEPLVVTGKLSDGSAVRVVNGLENIQQDGWLIELVYSDDTGLSMLLLVSPWIKDCQRLDDQATFSYTDDVSTPTKSRYNVLCGDKSYEVQQTYSWVTDSTASTRRLESITSQTSTDNTTRKLTLILAYYPFGNLQQITFGK